MYYNTMNNYKDNHSFEERKTEAQRIRCKYPNRIPVIVNRGKDCKLDDIDKKKYLVPTDITLGQFIFIIRKKIKLSAEEGLYLFINNDVLGTPSTVMSEVYNNYKDEDDFLYITYHSENTFG